MKEEETGKVVGFRNLKEIGGILSDVLIHRKKKDVLKVLPKQMDKTLLVPMTTEQMDHHRGYADEVAKMADFFENTR